MSYVAGRMTTVTPVIVTVVIRCSLYWKEQEEFPVGDDFSFIPTVMMSMGSEMKQTIDRRSCFVLVSSWLIGEKQLRIVCC